MLLFPSSIFLQNSEENLRNLEIQFSVYREFNNSTPKLISEFGFTSKGDIKQINRGPLNPTYSNDLEGRKPSHFAVYFYNGKDKLSEERLYQIKEENDISLLRTTQYDYSNGCHTVTVYSEKEGRIIGEMKECKNNRKITKDYKLDRVLGNVPSSIESTNTQWYYDENSNLNRIELLNTALKYTSEINFQYYKNKTIINSNSVRDNIKHSSSEYRFYDKKGRLSKIGTNDNKRDWHTKFCYDKSGFLYKIRRRGIMHSTGEKMKSNLLIKRVLHAKISAEAIEKINREIIKMYYPVSGQMMYLNYFDSRRFISHQG